MKPFAMSRQMLSLGGAFYPTGWVVAMLPSEDDVHQAAEALERQAARPDQVLHLPPEVVLRDLGGAVGESEVPLPSVGTEGESVRKYVALARQGHHGLMVQAPSDADTERVMQVLRGLPLAYAQKYHRLMIEDLHE